MSRSRIAERYLAVNSRAENSLFTRPSRATLIVRPRVSIEHYELARSKIFGTIKLPRASPLSSAQYLVSRQFLGPPQNPRLRRDPWLASQPRQEADARAPARPNA